MIAFAVRSRTLKDATQVPKAMSHLNLWRLLSLGALWGASFLFMRIGAPVLGPVLLIAGRVGSAALFLWVVGWVLKRRFEVRRHWRHFLILGGLNCAVPFVLLAYAAQTLSASLLSVLNATAPLFGALLHALLSRQRLSLQMIAGLFAGVCGVALLARGAEVHADAATLRATGAGLLAAFSYGLASTYAKRRAGGRPFATAHGSMWAATLLLLPALPFFPATASAGPAVLAAVLALGIACSGVAFLIYFKLIDEVGATSALTVTFLIPAFGILWGHLFLGERVDGTTLLGTLIVLLGAAWVTNYLPLRLRLGRPLQRS